MHSGGMGGDVMDEPNEGAEPRVKAKIIKHFVEQVCARWGEFRKDEAGAARRAAYIADAVDDLGPLTVDQLGETIREVRRVWEKDYRPEVREFRSVASRLGFFTKGQGGAGDEHARQLLGAKARRQADAFTANYMSNFNVPLVKDAWECGYYRELREYLTVEAVRQVVQGQTALSITVPDDVVEGWRANALALKSRAGGETELGRLVAEIRAQHCGGRNA